jgi:hypothetical protein
VKQALGTKGRHLPRYRPGQHEEDERQLARAIPDDIPTTTPTGKAGGDKRQLRGIPVVGSGGGASPGTDPLQALLDTEPDEPRSWQHAA